MSAIATRIPDAPDSLGDLPVHRREELLWWYMLQLDYDGVEAEVLHQAKRECPWRYEAERAQFQAVLADDGRFHMCVEDRVVCGQPVRRWRTDPSTIRHGQWCYWWSNGTAYRIQAPPGRDSRAPGGGHRDVRWTLRLTSTTAAPELVPRSQRCPSHEAGKLWPPYSNPAGRIGRMRTILIGELGAACHACHGVPGMAVDHDHRTGQVRGLLCRNCNACVDRCPHLSGCPWADYLNAPPAASLNLLYPANRRDRVTANQLRAQLAGFDLLDEPSPGSVSGEEIDALIRKRLGR